MRILSSLRQLVIIMIYACSCMILGVIQYGNKPSWPWEDKTEPWLVYICIGGIIAGWIALKSGTRIYKDGGIIAQRSLKMYVHGTLINAFWLITGFFFGGTIYLILITILEQFGNIILLLYLLFALAVNNVVNLFLPSILVGMAVSLLIDPMFNSIAKSNGSPSAL